jgi:hypothetical protein
LEVFVVKLDAVELIEKSFGNVIKIFASIPAPAPDGVTQTVPFNGEDGLLLFSLTNDWAKSDAKTLFAKTIENIKKEIRRTDIFFILLFLA